MKRIRVFLLLLAASVLCALPAFASEVVTLPEEDGGWTLQYEGQTVFRAEPHPFIIWTDAALFWSSGTVPPAPSRTWLCR